MSPTALPRYHVNESEILPDGTAKERFDGTCDAYVVGVAQERSGQLRFFTDHDGPVRQRRRAIQSLMTYIRATTGLGR
jgi:hypothetical protein